MAKLDGRIAALERHQQERAGQGRLRTARLTPKEAAAAYARMVLVTTGDREPTLPPLAAEDAAKAYRDMLNLKSNDRGR